MLICDMCGKKIELLDDAGWSLYYFGAGPNDPQNAKVRFCWAGCASKWLTFDPESVILLI